MSFLLRDYKFIVFKRDDIDVLEVINHKYPKFKDHFLVYDFNYKVSSSLIRENIEANKNMLKKEIYDYIKKHHLYEVDKNV